MDVEVDELDALGMWQVRVHFGGFVAAAGVDGAFESGDASETPLGVGEGLDELGFAGRGGLVFGGVGGQMLAVGVGVVGGEKDGAAGESGFNGVQGGDAFAFGSARATGSEALLFSFKLLQGRAFFDEFELFLVEFVQAFEAVRIEHGVGHGPTVTAGGGKTYLRPEAKMGLSDGQSGR